MITILEGESLVNDASALIAYRYAVMALTTGTFILWEAGLEFLLVAGDGILIGIGKEGCDIISCSAGFAVGFTGRDFFPKRHSIIFSLAAFI